MKFYMTYHRQYPNEVIPIIDELSIPIMTTAVSRFGANFGIMYDYPTDRIIDSGGYSVMKNHGDYPFTVKEYHDWLSTNSEKFDWVAAMDYACESEFDDIMSVAERVDRTIENTIEHFNYDPDYQLVPVLQGRLLHEYVDCYERLTDHGIDCSKVGLGTVCRMSREKKLVWLEEQIRDRTGVEHIHGFGTKISAYRHGCTFESSDSASWMMAPSYGRTYVRKDEASLEAVSDGSTPSERVANSFKAYYEHVRDVIRRRRRIEDGKLLNLDRPNF